MRMSHRRAGATLPSLMEIMEAEGCGRQLITPDLLVGQMYF